MSKIDEIRSAMVAAMKAGDKERKAALSFLLSSLKNKAIDKRADLTEEEEGQVILKEIKQLDKIIYVFLTIFLYLLKCPQSLILSALRAFCFCGKPHISRSIFLYFRYQSWLKSW